ncbi:3-hydroxy-D-aspartate aldolase [Mycoplana sp. BE70]|uniref:DSD1 family PLP-dependent enzyme n=1 Tax=Mycoplana sp. BE70 TaxID=2817775 RepID=UPI0028583BC6|nr:DSD1 family PLP-dependent enzyme [Mycoplana sp. BE70]MDR6759250.1 3-hydroxy-D-aspartate aldolase [Mycoplana sp. BE70]
MDDLEVGYDIPAAIGDSLDDVQTPALIIDLDAFERNCAGMRAKAEGMNVRLRAHAKTHKSADIALYQMARGGACGICCQKVSEAEALVRAGITDVLITNQVCGPNKIARLARLAKLARIIVCVDDATNVSDLSRVMTEHAVTLEVLVEIDCGSGRCGVRPGMPAVKLAQQVAASPNLVFAGIQAYHGSAQHIVDAVERRSAIVKSTAAADRTVGLMREVGLKCTIVGGAGTGTFDLEGMSGIYNELQCGSYIFMDAHYGMIRADDGGRVGGFENALFVLTSIISRAEPKRAVCDAGLKAHSVDSGLPTVFGRPDLTFVDASDEHGTIDDPGDTLSINTKLKLVPGHCDPTCNLHDWYVCVRGTKVEALWPVTARGKVF